MKSLFIAKIRREAQAMRLSLLNTQAPFVDRARETRVHDECCVTG
jgi:hypothetical protein